MEDPASVPSEDLSEEINAVPEDDSKSESTESTIKSVESEEHHTNPKGWAGLFLIVIAALLSAYTGAQLGWCWTILQERWPEYREQTRKPYPAIGFRALGKIAQYVVSICIDLTLFGVATVFLLLASGNISSLISAWANYDFSFCILLVILAAILLPVTFLGSPKDFWYVMVVAMASTSLAVILILVGVGKDGSRLPTPQRPPLTFVGFFLAFGTILFSYGGHAAFPTIQHDMKKPAKFSFSVIIAYVIIVMLYLPVGLAGYVVYGENVKSNIADNLGADKKIQQAVNFLITFHVLLSFIIVVNPLNQEIEEILNIPKNFNWKRALSRTVVMCAILFMAETVPRFGVLLSLIGATTVTVLTFVLPGIFHMMLSHNDTREHPTSLREIVSILRKNAWYDIMVNSLIIGIGLFGAAASTYSALQAFINPGPGGTFTKPCYAQ